MRQRDGTRIHHLAPTTTAPHILRFYSGPPIGVCGLWGPRLRLRPVGKPRRLIAGDGGNVSARQARHRDDDVRHF